MDKKGIIINLMCSKEGADLRQVSGNAETGFVFRCPNKDCGTEIIMEIEKQEGAK